MTMPALASMPPPVTTDPWLKDKWTIRNSTSKLHPFLPPGSEFKLLAILPLQLYRLEVISGMSPEVWHKLGLLAVGGTPVPTPAVPLPPWDPNDRRVKDRYTDTSDYFQKTYCIDTEFKRLESVFYVNKVPHVVRFYLSPDAIMGSKGQADFCFVDVLTTAVRASKQNGTAHGDPW